MNKHLKEFYITYYRWLSGEDNKQMIKYAGLCENLQRFLENRVDALESWEIIDQLQDQFKEAGLNGMYPFNDCADDYEDEVTDETCHLNEKRIAWVKEKVGEN